MATSTALIVWVGGIGQETAKLCADFVKKMLTIEARWKHDVPSNDKHEPDALNALLPQDDLVIVTVPHTPKAEGI